MLTLGKERIHQISDLTDFLEKEKDWYFALLGTNQAVEAFKLWISRQLGSHYQESKLQALIARNRFHVDKKFMKEALFRMINPDRDIKIKRNMVPFDSENVRHSFLDAMAFILHRWEALSIDELRFALFQLEASLSEVYNRESCTESKRILKLVFGDLRKYQSYQGKVPFPQLNLKQPCRASITKNIIELYKHKTSTDLLVFKVFSGDDGRYFIDYGLKKTLQHYLYALGINRAIESDYTEHQKIWKPDLVSLQKQSLRFVATEANTDLLNDVMRDLGLRKLEITANSFDYEKNGLLNSFLSCEKLLYDLAHQHVEHEISFNHFITEPGSGKVKIGYSLQSNLNKYLKDNNLSLAVQGSWMTYFYYPNKQELKDFEGFKAGLLKTAAERHKYPIKTKSLDMKTERDLSAAFKKHRNSGSRLTKALMVAAILALTMFGLSNLNERQNENAISSSSGTLSAATNNIYEGSQSEEIQSGVLSTSLIGQSFNSGAQEMMPQFLNGLSLHGYLDNNKLKTIRVNISNLAKKEDEQSKFLFDFNVNHKQSRGRDNTGGTQLAGMIDLDTNEIYFDNFYIGTEKFQLKKGKLVKKRNGRVSVVSLRGSPVWQLESGPKL